jgi:hypothetical protein
MYECCALFLNHKNDEITRRHFEILRDTNDFPVVPVHRGIGMRGSVNAWTVDSAHENNVEYIDHLLYNWYRSPHRLPAKRYVLIEYDTLATLPLREFYTGVWDDPAVAAAVRKPSPTGEWGRFDRTHLLPLDWQPFRRGVTPICGLLMARDVVEAVCGLPTPPGVFCELRLATAIRRAGWEITQHPTARRTVWWNYDRIYDPSVPGVYHPVKEDAVPTFTATESVV